MKNHEMNMRPLQIKKKRRKVGKVGKTLKNFPDGKLGFFIFILFSKTFFNK